MSRNLMVFLKNGEKGGRDLAATFRRVSIL